MIGVPCLPLALTKSRARCYAKLTANSGRGQEARLAMPRCSFAAGNNWIQQTHGYGMEDNFKTKLLLFGLLMMLAIPSGLRAQQAGYSQTNLVSNTAGVATKTDTQLLNPWGISCVPGSDFWIANN